MFTASLLVVRYSFQQLPRCPGQVRASHLRWPLLVTSSAVSTLCQDQYSQQSQHRTISHIYKHSVNGTLVIPLQTVSYLLDFHQLFIGYDHVILSHHTHIHGKYGQREIRQCASFCKTGNSVFPTQVRHQDENLLMTDIAA